MRHIRKSMFTVWEQEPNYVDNYEKRQSQASLLSIAEQFDQGLFVCFLQQIVHWCAAWMKVEIFQNPAGLL